MSAAREAGKKLLKKISPAERLRLSIFLSLILTFLARVITVRRIAPSGAAYFLSAYDVLIFSLILLPVGASEAVHELIQKRRKIGFLKNAGRIYTSAFLHVVIYIILVLLIWGLSAERFSENFLFGKAGLSTLLWMMPLFAVDAFTLILRGHSDGYYGGGNSGYILLIRQTFSFLLILIFAGIDSTAGGQVSKLLRNSEVQYIYDANGIIRLLIISAVAALLLYAVSVVGGHYERSLKRGRDGNRKHESPTGQFYTAAFPVSLALVSFMSFHFSALLIYGRNLRDSVKSLESYVWGMYSGILGSISILPLMIIFFLIYDHIRKTGSNMKGEDRGEYRIRCMNLSGESMIVCFFFAAFYAALAPAILNGVFKVDSALGLRLIRFGMIPMILCCLALNTSMQLVLINNTVSLAVHCLIALIPSASLMVFMPALNISGCGIYSVLLASGIFYLLTALLNYLKLSKELHYTFDIRRVILLPALCALVPGLLVLLVSLLFSLFMPAVLSVLICFIIYFFGFFFAVCKTGLLSIYSLKRIPLGRYVAKLALKLNFLEAEE